MSDKRKSTNTVKAVAMIGVAAAIATVLMFVKFPVKYLGFLELELSDIPAIFMSLAVGPVAGILVELIKNILHLTATSTGASGELSNFLVSIGYILPLSLTYHYTKGKHRLVLGFVLGTIGMAIVGIFVNAYITVPLYLAIMGKEAIMGIVQATIPSIQSVTSLILIGITPFNIFKGIIISVIGYFVFRALQKYIEI